MWLRELLELLDRNVQPSLIENMICMHIKQRTEQKIELQLKNSDDVKANRVVLEPYKVQGRYIASFWKDHQPKGTIKDLSMSEIKSMLNRYTVLEMV